MQTTMLRCGMRVPRPRVTVQKIGGVWWVLVDGIEDTDHRCEHDARRQARRTREELS